MRPGVTGKTGAFNGLKDPVRRLPVGDFAAQIAQLAELTRVAEETGVSLSMIDTLPLWQIAMVLQATQAQRLGLKGRATNLADGRVEVVVEGSEEVVVKMLDWLKSGPSSARVEHLVCQPCPEESGTFPDFRAY